MNRSYVIIFIFLTMSGCALLTYSNFDQIFGSQQVRNRIVETVSPNNINYWQEVKPVLDKRCVVCHGCYDAPCQLKLSAIEGIERGAHKSKVYNGSRLKPAPLTRLFSDEKTTSGWRNKEFFPVLNEYIQTPEVNKQAGIMYQLLDLKKKYPLPSGKILSDKFELGINREQVCPAPNELKSYKNNHPLWGMPYALPNITDNEQHVLKKWLEQGALYTARDPLPSKFNKLITKWEYFLNQDSPKAQLVSRYIFEHLFLGHLYFEDISDRVFFNLVRSATPPGQPIKRISTRRPYDDPGIERIYYRLTVEPETIVAKTHIPYALNEERMARWKQLFFNTKYEITRHNEYDPLVASNPFKSFRDIPMESRYRFMLDDAQFFIMGFIKGSVCRGQIALNVIDDHFWVFFLNPDLDINSDLSERLIVNSDDLELVSSEKNIYRLLSNWRKYAQKERRSRANRDDFMLNHLDSIRTTGLNIIWNGNKKNDNAALTVFRHFNSASVEKGLIGSFPKTSWIISYPLLERIHYLLVAGYDVYGNVGHQLLSRLHMDFLRMDGETGFLMMLPRETRDHERQYWYRGTSEETLDYLRNPKFENQTDTGINYKTTNHKIELYQKLIKHIGPALSSRREIASLDNPKVQKQLKRLAIFKGNSIQLLPEVSFIRIVNKESDSSLDVTLLSNTAHLNVTSVFRENEQLIPEENTVTLTKGLVGSYPNLFMQVQQQEIKQFVDQILSMKTQNDFSKLLDTFGIRRTDPKFWDHSDRIHKALYEDNPIEYGMLDYNRLENQ